MTVSFQEMGESFCERVEKVQVSSVFAMFLDLTMKVLLHTAFLGRRRDWNLVIFERYGTFHTNYVKCTIWMFHSLKFILKVLITWGSIQ